MSLEAWSELRTFRDRVCDRAARLEERVYRIDECARVLGLRDGQLAGLIFDGMIAEIRPRSNLIRKDSVQMMRSNPESVFSRLQLTTNDIRECTGLPEFAVSALISKRAIEPVGKRGKSRSKKKGWLYFRLDQLIKSEEKVEAVLSRSKRKFTKRLNEENKRQEAHVNDLHSKSQVTAERLDVDLESNANRVEDVREGKLVFDDWQKDAIQSLLDGRDVFVQAPTGAGKTIIVEEFIRMKIDEGHRLFYAVPIKALANDKFFDFCELYGRDRVGINTGDITLNPAAPLVVGTTEIVRNILYSNEDAYDTIAFDEAQYLGDEERGSAWEEAIILSSGHSQLAFLSGSVANGEEICSWIRKIKEGEIDLYIEEKRPVPLKFAFPFGNGFLEQKDWPSLESYSEKHGQAYYSRPPEFFKAVRRANMTPALIFMPRRRDCEEVFDGMPSIGEERSKELEDMLAEHPEERFLNAKLRRMIVRQGCAYHHSGLLPAEKRVVETLAKRGELDFVSATMSLASGVNFSVRTCVISSYRRPGRGGNMQTLAPSEILQMWGRAGRRRLDTEGYVIPCMNILDIDQFSRVKAYPEPIQRSRFISVTSILSILARNDLFTLERLCSKSLSAHQHGIQYRVICDATMERDAGAFCGAAAYQLPEYRKRKRSGVTKEELSERTRCADCPNLESCTKVYEEIKNNPLEKMIRHLKRNNYINHDGSLTFMGRVAERFHSEIGLLVAFDIQRNALHPKRLIEYVACVSASAHKDFTGDRNQSTHSQARSVFPPWLFPLMWERMRGRRERFIYWNPGAGVLAREWVNADKWEDFIDDPAFEGMQGDIFRVLLRAGELLRSMEYIKDLCPEVAEAAAVGYRLIMRPPLVPEDIFKD